VVRYQSFVKKEVRYCPRLQDEPTQKCLRTLREDRADILRIARVVQGIRQHGSRVTLTKDEVGEIKNQYIRAKLGNSIRPYAQGHEVAIWLWIIKDLGIHGGVPDYRDKQLMEEAFDTLKQEWLSEQLASLVIVGLKLKVSFKKQSRMCGEQRHDLEKEIDKLQRKARKELKKAARN